MVSALDWNSFYGGAPTGRNKPVEMKDPFPTDFWKYFDLKYWTDKPQSESQFKDQQTLDTMFPWLGLGNFHRSSEQAEKNANTMQLYNLSFSDIKYPWLSGITSTSGEARGLAYGSVLTVSKNLSRLYR